MGNKSLIAWIGEVGAAVFTGCSSDGDDGATVVNLLAGRFELCTNGCGWKICGLKSMRLNVVGVD